jgi:hypothetical protein
MGSEDKHKVRAKRHTAEQVIRKLREAEVMLGEGKTIPEVAKALEVSGTRSTADASNTAA